MNLSKIGRRYEVLRDEDKTWRPGTIVVAVEADSENPWCVTEEDYLKGNTDYPYRHVMYMNELKILPPVKVRKIEVEISTNRVGSEQTAIIEVDENATDEEIDQLAWEAACDMLNFTWRGVR